MWTVDGGCVYSCGKIRCPGQTNKHFLAIISNPAGHPMINIDCQSDLLADLFETVQKPRQKCLLSTYLWGSYADKPAAWEAKFQLFVKNVCYLGEGSFIHKDTHGQELNDFHTSQGLIHSVIKLNLTPSQNCLLSCLAQWLEPLVYNRGVASSGSPSVWSS